MRSNMVTNTFVALMALAIAGQNYATRGSSRAPASAPKQMVLHLQNLGLDPVSRFKKIDTFFLRATFDKKNVVELGKGENWTLNAGESRQLDIKIDIHHEWIKNDQFEFKLEFVQQGLVESVLIRCSTISKSVSNFNRAYNCAIPGETTPVLTYRLAGKGDALPTNNDIRTASRK